MSDQEQLAKAWDEGYEAALTDLPLITRWAHQLRGRKGTDVWAKWLALPKETQIEQLVEAENWPVTPFPDRQPRYLALLLDVILRSQGIQPNHEGRDNE